MQGTRQLHNVRTRKKWIQLVVLGADWLQSINSILDVACFSFEVCHFEAN
jgi:hypothetical protein